MIPGIPKQQICPRCGTRGPRKFRMPKKHHRLCACKNYSYRLAVQDLRRTREQNWPTNFCIFTLKTARHGMRNPGRSKLQCGNYRVQPMGLIFGTLAILWPCRQRDLSKATLAQDSRCSVYTTVDDIPFGSLRTLPWPQPILGLVRPHTKLLCYNQAIIQFHARYFLRPNP